MDLENADSVLLRSLANLVWSRDYVKKTFTKTFKNTFFPKMRLRKKKHFQNVKNVPPNIETMLKKRLRRRYTKVDYNFEPATKILVCGPPI